MDNPLNRFPLIATSNADEMEAVLKDTLDAQRVELSPKAKFFGEARWLKLGGVGISYCHYLSPTRLLFRESDYVRFQFLIRGSGQTVGHGEVTKLSHQTIVVSHPEAPLMTGDALEQLVLRIDPQILEQCWVELLGRRAPVPDFAPVVDLKQPRIALLRDALHAAVGLADSWPATIPKYLSDNLERTITFAALVANPSIVALLSSVSAKDAPWQVSRAEEWMDANLQQDIDVGKIAAATGTSVRSLFAAFGAYRNYSPMQFLKQRRLIAAREMLLNAGPETSVIAVALKYRFLNAGHFASDYKRQFGELPFETSRRAKSSLSPRIRR